MWADPVFSGSCIHLEEWTGAEEWRYGNGDRHGCEGEMWEDATGQDMERNQAMETNSPTAVPAVFIEILRWRS